LSGKPAEVVFSREALKDRRRIPDERIEEIASRLQMIAEGRRRNLDIKALRGIKPWPRLRVGNYRVVYRHSGSRILVARVVSRQELESALGKLRR
jgi:mRNA-degrading endonuclease RelE of RelBE toxin-antitoxin system